MFRDRGLETVWGAARKTYFRVRDAIAKRGPGATARSVPDCSTVELCPCHFYSNTLHISQEQPHAEFRVTDHRHTAIGLASLLLKPKRLEIMAA